MITFEKSGASDTLHMSVTGGTNYVLQSRFFPCEGILVDKEPSEQTAFDDIDDSESSFT